ncbi:Clp protease N-terminal domain-containing protein, partial [Persicitalea sp.]|uniref:Clp protease N-terminal domain-containing protein n=1 Tax=Persicitalea sp. TaxID=3100273 RepID=UPI00359405F7
MNFDQYTIKAQEVIQKALQIAQSNQQQAVETGHVLQAILQEDVNTSTFLMNKLNVNQVALTQALEAIVKGYPKVSGGQTFMGTDLTNALNKSQTYLKEFGDEFVSIELMLLGVLSGKDAVPKLMKDAGFKEKELKEAIK